MGKNVTHVIFLEHECQGSRTSRLKHISIPLSNLFNDFGVYFECCSETFPVPRALYFLWFCLLVYCLPVLEFSWGWMIFLSANIISWTMNSRMASTIYWFCVLSNFLGRQGSLWALTTQWSIEPKAFVCPRAQNHRHEKHRLAPMASHVLQVSKRQSRANAFSQAHASHWIPLVHTR